MPAFQDLYQQDYDPVLTVQTRPTHLNGRGYFGPCASVTRPDLHDADFQLNAVGDLNCLLGGNSEGTMRFDWGGSGPDTVVEYPLISLTVRPDGQTIAVVTGTVTSGPFKDGLMVFESNLLTLGVEECLTTGVESAAGPATVHFAD